MGHQVRFYSFPKDEYGFMEFIESIPETYFLSEYSSGQEISSFTFLWREKVIKQEFKSWYIVKGDINALKSFVNRGSVKRYNEEKMDFIETGEIHFWIDHLNAPLVEINSSFIRNDGKLIHGRIWADYYRLEGDQLVYKGDDFKEFYETLAKWIRTNFKHVKGIDGYFGEEALTWYENGGEIFI